MTVALSSTPSPESLQELSSSLESLTLHDTPHEADAKIAELRSRVLETIRNHFPITTLFTQELKIDLGVFIKDQMLFRKIAEFLAALPQTVPVDKDFIAREFDKSGLLVEIRALFKDDPTPYLASLFDACADVLNKKPYSQDLLKPAIEDRIFTLREALIAQHLNTIFKTQTQLKKIKEEGEYFIRECLRIHGLGEKVRPPFKAELLSTAEQLIPFVRNITKIYLKEHGQKDCPDNPLSFRNPSGYNHHGLTAATIMESCLHVLGNTTRVLFRPDLEPKVTLATAHSIVEVTAPDSSRYLVDPCYIQFHKDICMDDAPLPTSPVLVLSEDEVDTYIEEKLMVQWKATAELVKKGVDSVLKRLYEQDQIIPFIIDSLKFDHPLPSSPEDLVRGVLKRVWDVRTYSPILSNYCYQEIFVGNTTKRKTHAYIQAMGIGNLSHYLPYEEVHRRLMQFLLDPKLKNQNSPEALSLIAQLPIAQRDIYRPLLDLDPRINDNIGVFLNAYFRSLRKIVNPEGKDLSVIYGCSGPDCISVLLATDAQEFTFVDLTPLSYQEFDAALQQMKAHDSLTQKAVHTSLEQSDSFFLRQQQFGGAAIPCINGKLDMNSLALKFFFNLKCVGVDLDKVVLSSNQNENEVRVDFPWQYHGAAFPRNRSVIFVNADITNPDQYPVVLKAKLENKFDIFYMKAAYFVPHHYPQFLPHIANSMRQGGWLMTTDKSVNMEEIPPEKCLEQNGLTYALHKSEEKKLLEGLVIKTFSPFYSATALENYSKKNRNRRTVCTDLTYWSILNLRKRMI